MASSEAVRYPSTMPKEFHTIEELYNEAYALVDQGICYDEIGQRDGALAMYERGLQLIDSASEMHGCEQSELYQKMVRAREHIVFRLKDLRSGESPARPLTSPTGAIPPPYESITNALNEMGHSKTAEEVFLVPKGVQLFFIQGEDTTVPSYPTYLKIFKFAAESVPPTANAAAESPPAFLQVGDWIYPLMPGRSPVLHSTYGAYIFPNPTVDSPDAYVGVIFPSDLEASAVTQFEKLMKDFTMYKEEVIPPPLNAQEKQRLANRIASFLIRSGEFIAWGIKEGTQKTTTYITKQSGSIREKSAKTETPVTVNPRIQTSVHYLRKGTKVAIKISGYLVDKVGQYGAAIGKYVASGAEKRLEKKSVASAKAVQDVLEVASAGVAGVSTVWMSLEEAAKVLAKSLANETVQVVDHKYGGEAAGVTNELLYSAGFAAGTAWNVENLGIKAIAKRSAREASLAFLKDLGEKVEKKPGDPAPVADNANNSTSSSPKAKKKS